MGEVWYTTREEVRLALDFKETARDNSRIDSAIEASAREIEGCLHRVFYPLVRTRKFDWPNSQRAKPWRLWLDDKQLISLTSVTSGSDVIPLANVILYPDSGPPYSRIEVNLDTNSAFGSGSTHQNDIVIVGVWGFQNTESPAGALAEALDASETLVDVTNSEIVGVGQLIRIESERMLVTGKQMLDTTQDLGGAGLTASNADVTVPVTTGSAFAVGEVILIDAERMLITDISGNNLVVKRAWDGTVLAVHATGASLFAPRTLIVERGALGTTAATHADTTVLVKWLAPSTIRALNKAMAIDIALQESAGWARTSGSGESERETRAVGIAKLWDKAYASFGRKARIRGV